MTIVAGISCIYMNRLIFKPGPFWDEVSRVLGGGLVPAALVLIGGDVGVVKSTLMLQVLQFVIFNLCLNL
ncbi:hypothetical protein LXL04_028181 [Taraxacum kok-saghyz]